MKNFLKITALFLITGHITGANTLNPEQKRDLQFTTHSNAILIDGYEQTCQVITRYLKRLLESQSAALIFSSSLWPNILKCKPTNYNPENWINRKTTDGYFYVLVPKVYLNTLPPATAQGNWSANELRTGLKLDHPENLIPISDQDMREPEAHRNINPDKNELRDSESFIQKISNSFLKHFSLTAQKTINIPAKKNNQIVMEERTINSVRSDIFITNEEYFDAKASSLIPRPAMLLIGHGIYKKSIAYLEPRTLKKILAFFDERLSVPFVMIISCYAASLNMEATLKEQINDEFLIPHKFFLFSAALAAAPIEVALTFYSHQYHFDTFFKELRKIPPLDFTDINRNIHSFFDKRGNLTFTKNNFLMVKPPGQTWMYHVDLPEKVVSFGKALQTRTEPLDVSKFFAGRRPYGDPKQFDFEIPVEKEIYPELMLFYTKYIPFTLILSKQNETTQAPAFISMLPGDRVTTIEAVDARDFTLSQIVDALFPIKELKDAKIFTIKQLIVKNDVPAKLTGQLLVLEDVIALHTPKTQFSPASQNIFFNHNNLSWKADVTKQSLEQALTRDYDDQAAQDELKLLTQRTKRPSDYLFGHTKEESEQVLTKLQETIKQKALTFEKSEQLYKNMNQLAQGLFDIAQSQEK